MNIRHRSKSIKVVRRVKSGALTDDIEADFCLENDCKAFLQNGKAFLTEIPSNQVSLFNKDGRVKRTSIVGSVELFERSHSKPEVLNRSGTIMRRFTKSSLRSVQKDHTVVFENKLSQIKSGQALEKAKEKGEKSKMNIEQRLVYSKDRKSLKNFEKTSQKWENISGKIANALKKEEKSLLMNSGHEWRRRNEAIDYLERVTSIPEKVGTRSWHLSLIHI